MNVNINALDEMDSLLWASNSSTSRGFSYSPFGSTVARNDGDGLLPGFNGERPDPVSQSYNLGNGYRTYNPTLMRFNAPDSWSPFGGGGLNQYSYCEGDPINRSDPSGHMSTGSILGMTLGVAFGILGAILSFGTAIPAIIAAEGAVTAAQAALLVSGSLGVVADITGVASAATSESNPQASRNLGWASLAFGIASAVAGGVGDVHERISRGAAVDDLSRGAVCRGDTPGAAAASADGGGGGGRRLHSNIDLYEAPDNIGLSNRKRAVVSSHAQQSLERKWAQLPEKTRARFYCPDRTWLIDPTLGRVTAGEVRPYEVIPAGGRIKNYDLENFERDTPKLADLCARSDNVDVLLIHGDAPIDTAFLIGVLRSNGLHYDTIDFSHCRGVPGRSRSMHRSYDAKPSPGFIPWIE